MPISAAASRASRRVSRDAYEPRPGRHAGARAPRRRPPTVSRCLTRLVDARLEVVAEHAPVDLDPDLPQERLRDRARRDDHGRVPGACPLERVADVGEAVLEHAREIGVPGPRQRHRLLALPGRLALGRPRAHPPRPVLVVAVADDERERRAERAAVPEAGVDLDLVGLDLLARAAPVALLAAAQVRVDRGLVERQPGRQAADDRDQRRAVRLARRWRARETSWRQAYGGAHHSTGAGTPVQSSKEAAPCATSTSSPSITVAPASRAPRGRSPSPDTGGRSASGPRQARRAPRPARRWR